MTLNLNPVTNTTQPTSHVQIGQSKVGSSDVVRVTHRNASAHFYVDPVEDRVVNEIRNNVRVHENVGDVFGGVKLGAPFRVDPDASIREIAVCEEATVSTTDIAEDRLETYLRSTGYLLHPIEEVAEIDGSLVGFTVVELSPSRHTTLRVTDDTDIEFADPAEADPAEIPGPAAGRSGTADSPGSDPHGGGRDRADEQEVDIDLTPETPTVSFEEDVAGLEDVKRTARTLLALFDPEVKHEIERRYSREFAGRGGSMLLYGPPGCGKTLVSEAIAYEAKHNTNIEKEYGSVQFLSVEGGDILSRYPGEAERRVEAVFEEAHSIAQEEGFAVLFFDEVETLIPDRSDDDLQRHERSLTNAFLQAMNDIEDNLLVVGATNMPFTIDPAATRRFPIQQFIPQPGEEVMTDVWHKTLAPLEAADAGVDIDYERLGAESVGYTPAEIADRVLGADLQRDLVESVVDPDREPIEPDTEFLLDRLADNEPKTIRQYVVSVRDQADELEGYPEMRRYVENQADRLGVSMSGGGLSELLAAAETASGDGGDGDSSDDGDPSGGGPGGDQEGT